MSTFKRKDDDIFKRSQVIRLSTNQKADSMDLHMPCIVRNDQGYMGFLLEQSGGQLPGSKLFPRFSTGYDNSHGELKDFTVQHLYFTIDERPKVGEWYIVIRPDDNYIGQPEICVKITDTEIQSPLDKQNPNLSQVSWAEPEYCFKIVSTTDESLNHICNHCYSKKKPTVCRLATGLCMNCGKFPTKMISHPEPSKNFIKAYCKKGGIDEVMVEYGKKNISGAVNWNDVEELKVASDNTITVKSIKSSWSREEVEELINAHHNYIFDVVQPHRRKSFTCNTSEWIKNNL